ncbi:MAG: sensor domain-containing diguanylate cyclase [Nitrospiraceae bacterium]|nr:sensor domain-containing diguanylate cyclase [Nitrospiraceae bacterium]
MHKVLLIGAELPPLGPALAGKDYRISRFGDPLAAIPEIPRASLIIVNTPLHKGRGGPDELKEFLARSEHVPRIFVSAGTGKKPGGFSRKKALTYTVDEGVPPRELGRLVRRIGEEKRLYDENRTFREQNRSLQRELKFFEDISRTLTSAAGHTDVLALLAKKIKEKTGAENCTIYLVDEQTGSLAMEKTEGPLWKKEKTAAPHEVIAARVAREGKPLLIANMYKENGFTLKMDRDFRHKINTAICVPLKSKGKVLGALELINRQSGEAAGEEFTPADLASVTRFTDYAAIIIERATLFEKMQELVVTDDLTKLFNTRYMTRSIGTEVLRSNRYNTSVSLLFMDIDHFKQVNDTYGHLVGSKLLVEMGQLLLRHLRELDIVTRYGGDEFVIILPQTPPQKAVKTAERIRQTVEQHAFLKKEGYDLRLTASFGVASYPESAGSQEELIRLADEAMYKVKHRSRNGVYAIIGHGSV